MRIKLFLKDVGNLFQNFRDQEIPVGFLLALALLLLSIIFGFIAAAPVLSPFIYPLF